jgi:phosphatidylglycerophosphate synthase
MRSFALRRLDLGARPRRRRREAASAALLTGLAVVAGASGFVVFGGFAPLVAVGSLAAFAILAVLVVGGVERHHSPEGFGLANRITLSRGALNAVLVGLLLQPTVLLGGWAGGLGSAVLGLAVVSLSLDGVDGHLARRRGETSSFGARFDVEVDATLLAVLSALLVALDRAGPWVMAGPALYYAFVAARRIWPWLRRDLPPASRRKVVFVAHVALLLVALLPVVEPALAARVAAVGVMALAGSFLVDLRWLRRHADA